MTEEEKPTQEGEAPKFTVTDKRHWVDEDEDAETSEPEDRLPTFVEQLKKEAEEKDKRLRDYIAAYKAKGAENDEFRQRLQRENDSRLDQSKANLFGALLPILDNLKRASLASKENKDFDSLSQGVEMIISQFSKTLEENGVKSIDTINRAFNAATDEVFLTEETEDPAMDNFILEELEPGYMYKDKLIKPTKVKVGKLKN